MPTENAQRLSQLVASVQQSNEAFKKSDAPADVVAFIAAVKAEHEIFEKYKSAGFFDARKKTGGENEQARPSETNDAVRKSP